MATEMESQIAVAEDGFTQVTRKGGRRAKKRQAEELSASGEGGDASRMDTEEARPAKRPVFPPLSGDGILNGKEETRKIPVPANRYTPLKENWLKIFTPIVEHLGLQIRFNLKSRNVEIRTCKETKDVSALTKAADFVKAFILGFQVEDALALIRLDDLFLESFEITDGKFTSLALSKTSRWQELPFATSSWEILHQKFMAIFELWLAEQQIDFDFKSETLERKTLPFTSGHKKPCEGFFSHFKSPSLLQSQPEE
ncbi:RNA-binding protein PNO1 isoform X1 [Phyllostomus discolor]|uniref:RNA-binding protein PNO1 isoform X1 n=1 Tax=Phyllostomus discolor TaxID=89673 RepID=A0A7E6DYI1_9CHIR|nr:RNA-binding protein PNO1 isoform X1 [Phyllostomus discolor]